MLTYTFSRREKFLIGFFGLMLIGVAWFQLVYVNTNERVDVLQAEIDATQSEILGAQTKVAKKFEMEKTIELRKAEGAKATPIPDYDNIEPLMSSLSPLTDRAEEFSIIFEDLDIESTEYVLRNVQMQFTCGTYEEIENILKNIVEGEYPCIVDRTTISPDRLGTRYVVNAHVVFFELPNEEMLQQKQAQAAAEAAAAAAATEE